MKQLCSGSLSVEYTLDNAQNWPTVTQINSEKLKPQRDIMENSYGKDYCWSFMRILSNFYQAIFIQYTCLACAAVSTSAERALEEVLADESSSDAMVKEASAYIKKLGKPKDDHFELTSDTKLPVLLDMAGKKK